MKANYYCLHENLQNHIKRLILRNGPGVVIINGKSFHHLKGKYNGKCKISEGTHAVLLAGLTKKHWIIKNSWDKHWGINGYLYIPIKDCNCNLNQSFTQVIVNKKHKH